ncbi:MAG: N5-glutamine methyltransferase family protein [Acidimicrobiales bacterium]
MKNGVKHEATDIVIGPMQVRWIEEASYRAVTEGRLRNEDREPWCREIEQRARSGEPLQYLLGYWSFRELELHVDQRALIPRPETELIVDLVADALGGANAIGTTHLGVEVGVGTGAISLALASEIAGVTMWGTEISPEALELARENASLVQFAPGSSAQFVRGNVLAGLPDEIVLRAEFLVSNPPYLSDLLMKSASATVRDFEPTRALHGGADGLDVIRVILEEARQRMAVGSFVVIEYSSEQREEIMALARGHRFVDIVSVADLTGRDRFMFARHG